MLIPILHLAGSAHQRGELFGEARRSAIASWIADWFECLGDEGIASPDRYLREFLTETDFVRSIEESAPELLEEIAGIGRGAEIPIDIMLAAQLMDEEWAYRASFNVRAGLRQKCSAVAMRDHDGCWIGQNMDLGCYTDGHQLILRLSEQGERPAATVFSMGGMIALFGVNEAGVAVCVNSLPQLPTARSGVPVAFIIRRLLECSTAEQAAYLVKQLPHATGQHYLVSGPQAYWSLEASPEGICEYFPKDPDRLFHTNHPLAGTNHSEPQRSSTTVRMAALVERLGRAQPGFEAIAGALASRDDPDFPVSRDYDAAGMAQDNQTCFTTGSMISFLPASTEAQVKSWATNGPPSRSPYQLLRFS